jgi:SPP1 family predicted phage head-tail adaptor
VIGLAAGELNRQITIRKRGVGLDALNRPNQAYVDYATVWANIKAPTGLGRIVNESVSATLSKYSFRIRFRTDITIDMIVVYGGQEFAIVEISHDFSDQNYTDLVCSLGTLT